MSNSILIFDSGVGGLSIAKDIKKRLPASSIMYLMDDATFPYGIQEDHLLSPRITSLCREAVEHLNPDLLVIACNTASTLALSAVRKLVSVPVVGVVPAIKTAAEQTTTGNIGLLATPATVSRPYTRQLIDDFAPQCSVRMLGDRTLVDLAEEVMRTGQQPAPQVLHLLLDDWLMSPKLPSHVVLGCTHFPLLKPALSATWPHISWIDSGAAVARRVQYLLELNPRCSEPKSSNQTAHIPDVRIYWTQNISRKEHPSLTGILQYGADWGRVTHCSRWDSRDMIHK